MKRYALGLALLGLAGPLFAQNEDDALRYSRLQFGGTARTLGIGGASTSLGADLGTLSSNPAGLGLFQRSEVSFSPGFGLGNADARVTNVDGSTSLKDSRNSLHIGSLAAAFTSRRPDSDNDDWRSGTLAFGFTRISDFNNSFSHRSTLPDARSLFQRLREPRLEPGQSVAGLRKQLDDEFVTGNYSGLDGLAYGTYLTNYDEVPAGSGNEVVSTPTPLQRTRVTQEETVLTTGSQTQFDIGYGASYRDQLYIGGAIGIVGTHFNSTSELRETNDASNTSSSFGSLTLRDELRSRGTGFNARLGLIYRPLDWLRVGLSAQTPTAYQFDDTYNSSLSAQFRQPISVDGKSISSAKANTQELKLAYRMTSPWRLNGGASVILGKYGFVSADAELVDYSQARFRSAPDLQNGDNYSFSAENARISQLYGSALNLRVGAEARLAAFRVRGGYAHYGDPFQDSRFDRSQEFYTGGLGLRQGNISADLAGVYTTYNRIYSPYTLVDGSQPEVQMNASRFTTTFTLGYQF
ncbi:OmpP1/FadL family transporter [Hymenobacter jeollabukensis]|uniref:Aromatic hydrocarbon degradation protein n=1 Tax=Hymenobacter jeollabukensis TaxID=2025313 RepID=A0A5R8WV15_9BACT|nr:hypothetical protein [Hymenobacter jeollabukensis]TLM95244.1 hypothetical protein FDY95_05510 [Hymenobacter jeollabukensis]